MQIKDQRSYALTGRITNQNKKGQPLPGLVVRAFDDNWLKQDDLLGIMAVTDADGRYRVTFAEQEFRDGKLDKDEPDVYIKVYEDDLELGKSEVINNWNPKIEINLEINYEPTHTIYLVEGNVVSRTSPGLGGLRVVVVDKAVGADVELGESVTDNDGAYRVGFTDVRLRKRGKALPDLQVRVYGGKELLAASEVRYNATNRETINLLLDEKAIPALTSEHDTLKTTLAQHYTGNLKDLQETQERRDITYLANKSGWDARAVAMAALADQFHAKTREAKAEIAAPFFYALFRAGLPTDDNSLYHTDSNTVETVWKQAIKQGIIPQSLASGIDNAKQQFQQLAAQQMLNGPALTGLSSLKDMLSVASITDAKQQEKFAAIYAQHNRNAEELWKAVRGEFGEQTEQRLKLDGQLAYLTLNNAPLIDKLHKQASGQTPLNSPLDLVKAGFHQAAKWQALIGENDKLPPGISGNDKEQRQRYAELMAAQMRLSYPTAVTAQMIQDNETPLSSGANGQIKGQVVSFLNAHHEAFQIGMQPVEQYVRRNKLQVAPEVLHEIERIQRVRQVTTSDRAMNALLSKGVSSAYQAVRYGREGFALTFKDDLGGEANAQLIYDKIEQVHNATLNIAVSYLHAKNSPKLGWMRDDIGSHTNALVLDPTPKPPAPANVDDVIAYASLEKLFGEMDYCECQHCRSWLSPAAYLVDLLQFLERADWPAFQAEWSRTHRGASYPFGSPETTPNPAPEPIQPLDVLLSRRPDLQHLPLTCENTNTPLPYIDLVNETLEHYVTHHFGLDSYKGHTTDGNVSKEELLANPQFVNDEAYRILASQHFPTLLPFNRPLEYLRCIFDKFEMPLPEVMETLRKNVALERTTEGDYGWRDILMEELRLSREEYRLLTDRSLSLAAIYGFGAGTLEEDVLTRLSNAKAFTRRVSITYLDIVEILKTRFINQHATLIPKLERLGVPFSTLKAFKEGSGTISDKQFEDALAPGLDVSRYGGDIKAWVRNDGNYRNIMSLITLADPNGEMNVCSFDKLEFRYADGRQLEAVEYYRLLRFIRLWKKLGWTIEQTDRVVTALYPASPAGATDLERLDNGFLTMLPRLGVLQRAMESLKLNLKKDLPRLLACFAPINTQGEASLYRQMFLNSAILQQDRVFADDGYGNVMQRFEAAYTGPALPTEILAAAAGKLTDDREHERLFYSGIMSSAIRDDLKRVASVTPLQTAIDALYDHSRLVSHTEALRAAFNLTDDEFSLITASLGFSGRAEVSYAHSASTLEPAILNVAPNLRYDHSRQMLATSGPFNATTRDALKTISDVSSQFQDAVDQLYERSRDSLAPLTLENISAVFRRGWLARKLKLSVKEFLLLTQLTGVDPFDLSDVTDAGMLRLVELVGRLRAASLKSAAALYLIWNQDISGKSAPKADAITSFARSLRAGFAAIESEFAIADDPDGKIARARMALVYGNEATDFFFGLLDNTFVAEVDYNRASALSLAVSVDYDHGLETLEPAFTGAAPELAYDRTRKRLSFSNALTVEIVKRLKDAAEQTFASPDLQQRKKEFNAALDALAEESRKVVAANLGQDIVNAAPGRIAYDDFRKKLSFKGIMTENIQIALKNGTPREFENAVDDLFAVIQKVITPFFNRYPELQPLYEAHQLFGELKSVVNYRHHENNLNPEILKRAPGKIIYDHERRKLSFIGVFSEATRDAIFSLDDVTGEIRTAITNLYSQNREAIQSFFDRYRDDRYREFVEKRAAYEDASDSLEKRRSVLLTSFLPELKRRRKRQQALQVIATEGKSNVEFAAVMLNSKDNDKYVMHAVGRQAFPALDDLTAMELPGLSAQFLDHESQPLAITSPRNIEANLSYSLDGNNHLPPNGDNTISGVWTGYLEAPESNFFKFYIKADAGATVTLEIAEEAISLEHNENIWSNRTAIEFKAGALYAFTLRVQNVKDRLAVHWETRGRGQEVLPARYLYSAELIGHLRDIYVRFLKAASVAEALNLSATELAHLSTHTDYRIGGQGWLNSLPVVGDPEPATATALFKSLEGLLNFAQIKAELSPNDESLLAVIKDPEAIIKPPAGTLPLGIAPPEKALLKLTRWDSAALDALLERFFGARDRNLLKSVAKFRRVHEAYARVKKLGVSAAILLQSATNTPKPEIVRDLQAALRARYEAGEWLNVVKPINDQMRGRQRDALVAYILHRMGQDPTSAHIDTPEKLFEFFLMDVQMEPCMLTSRIRHALSSVQLFIDRSLMNLEPRVAPSAINAKQWQWMNRYRVWEANRKVFLWPENWLEPELRDDQSPFFKETMSELLQGDITEDRAATALLNYLAKLEEVAKLEVVGMYYDEKKPDNTQDDVVHVVARTNGANRKYFYRRREFGSWTPWEEIKLRIEDDPVVPVVWKGRLFLFWLQILQQGPSEITPPTNIPKTQQAAPGTPPSPDSTKLADMTANQFSVMAQQAAVKTVTQSGSTNVTVQAVLCWSEYYNGKWQATKTSDLSRPTVLGKFNPNGPNAFDRSAYRLAVAERNSSLQVFIWGRWPENSFYTIYNTFSTPVRMEDRHDFFSDDFGFLSKVSFSTQNKDLSITYRNNKLLQNSDGTWAEMVLSNLILTQKQNLIDQVVTPLHKLENPFGIPFFYRDDLHQFYVTTARQTLPMLAWNWFVPIPFPSMPLVVIPDLIVEFQRPRFPDIDNNLIAERIPGFGFTDPSPIDQVFLESRSISRGIPSRGLVRFGETEIGLKGGFINKLKS